MQRINGIFVNVNVQSFALVGGPGNGLIATLDNSRFDKNGNIIHEGAIYNRPGPKTWQADGGKLNFVDRNLNTRV